MDNSDHCLFCCCHFCGKPITISKSLQYELEHEIITDITCVCDKCIESINTTDIKPFKEN